MSNDNTRIYKMEFFKDFVGTISQFQQLLRNLDRGQAGEQYGDAQQQRKLYEAISKGFTLIHPNPSVNSIDEGDLGTYIYVNGIYYKTLTGGANSVEANNFWTQWLTNNTIIDTQQIKFYKNGYATEEDSKQASSNIPGSVIFDQTHQAIFVDGLKYGGTQIPLSNTVWVNLDLTENDTTNHIFKSWVDAKDWIIANTDYSESNLWQIMLPSGNVGDVTVIEGIRLGVTDGTVIERLGSNITFDGDYNTVGKAYLAGAIINNLDLGGNGKCCALYNCVVKNVIKATSTVVYVANDCQFLAGDFENYEGFQSKCRYSPILGDIDNLSSNGLFNDFDLVDGFAFELNCIYIRARFSKIYATSISGELDIENCFCSDLSLSAEAKITNSSMGRIIGRGTANITVENSRLQDVILEDTATLTHENSIIGTTTVATGATLTRISEPYDNTISGLNALNVQDAIDELTTLGGGLISILYNDLISAINDSKLKPGSQYLITDFAQSYNIFDSSTGTIIEEQTGVLEPIIVTAASTNSIYKDAISTLYPKDIIHYSIDLLDNRDIGFGNGVDTVNANFKGMIYYRKDTVQNVETHYDFRNVKFRRWAVDATEWTDIGFTANDVIKSAIDGKIYKCILTHTATGIDPSSDAVNWILWLDIVQDAFVSWTSDKTLFNIGDITTDNLIINNVTAGVDYNDFYTFGDYYKWVKDVEIGGINLELMIGEFGFASILISQKVFKTTDNPYTCFSMTFGDNNLPMTFGDINYSMTFGDINYSMTFGNGNYSMTFGNGNYSMTFGNGNYSMTFGYKNRSMTFGNGNYSMTFGYKNRSMTFGDINYSMTFGDYNNSMTFGDYNNSMTFGDYNNSMTFGDNNSMTFGNGNYSMTFGNGNGSMTFGNGNYSMTFGNGNGSMTFGNGNYSMTFGDYNNSMTFGDNNSMTFGNGNYSMTFGYKNRSMTFGNNNNSMTFGNNNNSMTFGNGNYSMTFGDNNSMTFRDYNNSMTFGDYNNSMTFGNSNYSMTFGDNNRFMTFGDNNSMTFGNSNGSMTFGNGNYSMTFGDNNRFMTFGDYNNSMTFGNNTNPKNRMITFGDNTTMCVFEHRCFTGLVADLDLSAATHIKGTYNTTIYQDAVDGVKLSYMSGGMMQIVDITD